MNVDGKAQPDPARGMSRRYLPQAMMCLLIIVLALPTGLPARGFSKKEVKMKSSEQIAKSILSISEDRYFNDTQSLFLDMELKLSDTEFRGVAINAPAQIATEKHDQLPVIIAIQETGLRAWQYPRDMNCIAAATDMDTRTVYFGQVFRDPKAEVFAMPPDARQPPKPEGANAVALTTGLDRIDARTVLSLPWRAGKYRLAVLMFDQISNTLEVNLTGDAADQAAHPAVTPSPAAPGQAQHMPSFLPEVANVSLAGDKPPFARMTLQPNPAPGVKLAVHGAFTVLAAPFHLPPAPYELQETDGKKHSVAAVVPATLAIIGKNWSNPLRFDWAVPVYSPSAVKAGDPIQGNFAIDPLADSPLTLVPGEYAAYLLVEGHVFGPTLFQVP